MTSSYNQAIFLFFFLFFLGGGGGVFILDMVQYFEQAWQDGQLWYHLIQNSIIMFFNKKENWLKDGIWTPLQKFSTKMQQELMLIKMFISTFGM